MTVCKRIKNWWDAQSPFKAYIGWNLFIILAYMYILFTIPIEYPEGHPIYGSEAMGRYWNYTNATVYFYSALRSTIIYILLFFLAMSNKDKHPKLAKFLFLFPWLMALIINLHELLFNICFDIL